MFWIENALYPLICDVFIQTCKFIHFLENSGIGLAFSSIFNVFWFLRVGATLSFWVQFGCKSPKKRIHCNNAQQTLLFYTCLVLNLSLLAGVEDSSTKSSDGWGDDDDPWAAIAAPPPPTTVRALNPSSATRPSAARRPAQQAQHVSINGVSSSGRGRGRAAPMKLGASRIVRTSE
jgi:hypothetical protein